MNREPIKKTLILLVPDDCLRNEEGNKDKMSEIDFEKCLDDCDEARSLLKSYGFKIEERKAKTAGPRLPAIRDSGRARLITGLSEIKLYIREELGVRVVM